MLNSGQCCLLWKHSVWKQRLFLQWVDTHPEVRDGKRRKQEVFIFFPSKAEHLLAQVGICDSEPNIKQHLEFYQTARDPAVPSSFHCHPSSVLVRSKLPPCCCSWSPHVWWWSFIQGALQGHPVVFLSDSRMLDGICPTHCKCLECGTQVLKRLLQFNHRH